MMMAMVMSWFIVEADNARLRILGICRCVEVRDGPEKKRSRKNTHEERLTIDSAPAHTHYGIFTQQ